MMSHIHLNISQTGETISISRQPKNMEPLKFAITMHIEATKTYIRTNTQHNNKTLFGAISTE